MPNPNSDRLLLRLHFRSPGGVGDARTSLIEAIRNQFNVPDDVQLWQVSTHWLNVNPSTDHADAILDWLADNLPQNTINAYPMDQPTADHPAVHRFFHTTGFAGRT